MNDPLPTDPLPSDPLPSDPLPSDSLPTDSLPTDSMSNDPLRVVIADDQEIVRSGIRLILEAHGIDVVGEGSDGRAAVELARRLRPDVCLVDIRMPKLDGLEVTRMLAGRDVDDPIPVVVVTTFDHDEYVNTAIRNGASGFLLKDAGPALLVEAVRARRPVMRWSRRRSRCAFSRHFNERNSAPSRPEPTSALTEREEDIVRSVARGPHERRDRRATVHFTEHGEESCRQHPEQAGRPQPSRDRRLGMGNRQDVVAGSHSRMS